MSLDLVIVDGERRIDSRIVARGIHVQHDNLMQTIYKYWPGWEKYRILLFETGKIKRRGRPEQYALLNKEQFGYLLMFVRVMETVRAYREDVYDKFPAYEQLQQGMPVQSPQAPAQAPAPPAINSLWEQRLIDFNRKMRLPAG
jgi:phage regulator Rha-like protein